MSKARRARVTDRSRRRDRHGRGLRSSAAGPHLPFLRTRVDLFDDIVAATADTSFEVAGLPADPDRTRVERWSVDRAAGRVVLYRLPIERLAPSHDRRVAAEDEWNHRVLVEGYVFRAVADLLGKDPWELAPDRWRDG
jgi:hypothetical protein